LLLKGVVVNASTMLNSVLEDVHYGNEVRVKMLEK